MSSLTVRNIDPSLKTKLRIRAARNGHSMEQEVRVILQRALETVPQPEKHPGDAIRDHFAALGGVELEIPPRETGRGPPDFSQW